MRYYAICGIMLLFIYKLRPKTILVLAVVFSVPLTAIVFIANSALGLQQYTYDYSIATRIFTVSTYLEYLRYNFTLDPLVNFVQDSPLTLVSCFGKILIGFWLGMKGFFFKPLEHKKLMKKWMIAGLLIGIPSSVGYWAVTKGLIELDLPLLWVPFLLAGGLVLHSLLYIAAFIKLFFSNSWQKLLFVCAPVGRMALSNYLLQTVFYLLVFYNWTLGLNLYGKLRLLESVILVMLFFFLQVLLSRWWLSKFSQGPIEYLWKRISHSYRPYKSDGSNRTAEAPTASSSSSSADLHYPL